MYAVGRMKTVDTACLGRKEKAIQEVRVQAKKAMIHLLRAVKQSMLWVE